MPRNICAPCARPRRYFARENLVHPGTILYIGNWVLRHNVVLGPWMHVGSTVQHFAAARVGDELSAYAVVTANYERKGHRFVELDVLVYAGQEVRSPPRPHRDLPPAPADRRRLGERNRYRAEVSRGCFSSRSRAAMEKARMSDPVAVAGLDRDRGALAVADDGDAEWPSGVAVTAAGRPCGPGLADRPCRGELAADLAGEEQRVSLGRGGRQGTSPSTARSAGFSASAP